MLSQSERELVRETAHLPIKPDCRGGEFVADVKGHKRMFWSGWRKHFEELWAEALTIRQEEKVKKNGNNV